MLRPRPRRPPWPRSRIRRGASCCATPGGSPRRSASCASRCGSPGAPGSGARRRRAGHPGRDARLRRPHRGRAWPRSTRRLRPAPGVLAGRVLMRRGSLLRDARPATTRRWPTCGARSPCCAAAATRCGRPAPAATGSSIYAVLGQAARADRDLAVAAAPLRRRRAGAGVGDGDAQPRPTWPSRPATCRWRCGLLDEAAARYAALSVVDCPTWRSTGAPCCWPPAWTPRRSPRCDDAVARAGPRRGRTPPRRASCCSPPRAPRSRSASRRGPPSGRRGPRDLFRAAGPATGGAPGRTFVLLQSRYDAGDRGGRLRAQLSRARRPARRARRRGGRRRAPAGRSARRRARARLADADRHLDRAARFRHRGPTFGHAAGWLAHALRAAGAGRAPGPRWSPAGAASRPPAAHQRTLGATELRAHAAAYGTELAAIAQRHAVRRGDARMLLLWSERWRAGALAVPAVRPPDDGELADDLAALRDVVRRLGRRARRGRADRPAGAGPAPAGGGDPGADPAYGRRRGRRRRDRCAAVAGPGRAGRRLGDGCLVEMVALDDTLLRGHRRRPPGAHAPVGPVADADPRGRAGPVHAAPAGLRAAAAGRARPAARGRPRALQDALLGPAAADLARADCRAGRRAARPAARRAVGAAARAARTRRSWWRRRRRPGCAPGELRPPRRRRVALVVGPGPAGHGGRGEADRRGLPGRGRADRRPGDRGGDPGRARRRVDRPHRRARRLPRRQPAVLRRCRSTTAR